MLRQQRTSTGNNTLLPCSVRQAHENTAPLPQPSGLPHPRVAPGYVPLWMSPEQKNKHRAYQDSRLGLVPQEVTAEACI